jgi:dextranase
VARLWWATPDGDDPALHALFFTAEDNGITFTLPSLAYWDLLLVEYGTGA